MNTIDEMLHGIKVLDAFLEHEVRQYPKFVSNPEECQKAKTPGVGIINDAGRNFIQHIKNEIVTNIPKIAPDGFDFLKIIAVTNMGLISCVLEISAKGKYFNWKTGDVIVNLCSCGNLNHWGSVEFIERKSHV